MSGRGEELGRKGCLHEEILMKWSFHLCGAFSRRPRSSRPLARPPPGWVLSTSWLAYGTTGEKNYPARVAGFRLSSLGWAGDPRLKQQKNCAINSSSKLQIETKHELFSI